MAAITGIITPGKAEDLSVTVAAMCEIQTRGESGSASVWCGNGACLGRSPLRRSREECSPSTGPLPLPDGTAAIVWDGFLMNGAQLAHQLGLAEDSADQAIAMACWRKWGTECASKLDGTFAFAVWDGKNGTLYAARDRLGEKPLYYSLTSSSDLIFASEIKGILRSGMVPRDLDPGAIYRFLIDKGFNWDETPLEKVRSIPPGYWMKWRGGDPVLGEYWDIPLVEEKISDVSEALDRSRELLLEAVAERISGESDPAVFLSGGIDSSLLLGVCAAVTDRRIMTVTLVPGAKPPQVEVARSLAEKFGTRHVEVGLEARELGEHLEDFVWCLSKPTPGSIMNYFCSKAASAAGASTVISGHMSDSIFQADSFAEYACDMDRIFSMFRIIPEKTRVRIYGAGEHGLRSFESGGNIFARQLMKMYQYFRKKRGMSKWFGSGLHPEEARSLFSPSLHPENWSEPADFYRWMYKKCGSSNIFERLGYTVIRGGLIPSAILNYESIGSAFGLRVEGPFHDQQLVEFSRSIPHEIRNTGGNSKYIPATLCAEFATAESAIQKKGVLSLPFSLWIAEDLRPIVESALSKESIDRRGLFDHGNMQKLLERHRQGDAVLSWADILAPVIIELWLRSHVDPKPEDLSRPSSEWACEILSSGKTGGGMLK